MQFNEYPIKTNFKIYNMLRSITPKIICIFWREKRYVHRESER